MDQERQRLLEQAATEFAAHFPTLMQEHPGEWVAYHGNERLGFAPTKVDLLRACYAQGYTDEQLFVAKVQPDVPEEYAVWEAP